MLSDEYSLCYAEMNDIDSWIKMVHIVKDKFSGLETAEKMDGYKQIVIKNIKRKTALCVKYNGDVVGVIIFSYNSKCLSFMAVHPDHRRKGIASAMIEKMLSLFPNNTYITVTTYRANDVKGIAPRALYKKYGFEEDELVTEFNYPLQKLVLNKKIYKGLK